MIEYDVFEVEDDIRLASAADPQLKEKLEDPEFKKKYDQGRLLIPRSHLTRLRRAFTPRGVKFFLLYRKLWELRLGLHREEDLVGELRMYMRMLIQLTSPVDKKGISPSVVNMMAEHRQEIFRFIREVQKDPDRPMMWRKLNRAFIPMMMAVAADKGVFFKKVKMPMTNPQEMWVRLHKMRAPQEKLLALKEDDPESYQLMIERGQTLKQIDEGIANAIKASGMKHERTAIMNRPVNLGIDSVSGEKIVFDRDGEQLSIEDYIEKRKRYFATQKRLQRNPKRVNISLKKLRKVDDDTIDAVDSEIKYVSLSDDKAKQGKLTRYFPVKTMSVPMMDENGVVHYSDTQVVSGGRYKGCYLDDMINDQGRLIEGTAYTYNPQKGEKQQAPSKIDPSDREPYITVHESFKKVQVNKKPVKVPVKKMMVKIDGSNAKAKLRKRLKDLCCAGSTKTHTASKGCLSSMEWHGHKEGNAISVYFEPKDFGLLMDELDGMSLSEAAVKEMKKYYKELAEAEEATRQVQETVEVVGEDGEITREQVFKAYTAAKLSTTHDGESYEFIEGFTRHGKEKKFDLLIKQQEALAWLDTNGGNGVCALETGVGKTLTAIGGMVKAVRDGWLEEGASYTRPDGKEIKTNGRFLYVCPPSLVGNMPAEIEKFIKGNGGGLKGRVDCLPYSNFSGASRSGKIPAALVKQHPDYWKPLKEREKAENARGKQAAKKKHWDPAEYIQIYFDEAHELKNPSSLRSQAALKLWHPKKVCLTASPMEKNPMEAYVLSCVSNNTPLFGRDYMARSNRKEMRRFKDRFCNVVGGRIIGATQEKNAVRDMKTWVKRNVFFADKTKVDEYNLPDPIVETRPATMAPEVEKAYRAITNQMTSVLKAAEVQFRERRKQDSRKDKLPSMLFGLRLRPYINLLNTLSNRPADAMKDLAAIASGDIPEKYEYSKRFQKNWGRYPRGIKKIGQDLLDQLGGPEQIEALAESIGNPKLDAVQQTVLSKMEAIEGSRALIFTDDTKLAMDTVIRMSSNDGGVHALCLKKEIQLWSKGSPLSSWSVPIDAGDAELLYADRADEMLAEFGKKAIFSLPFSKRKYRRYPNLEPKTTLKRAEGLNANYPPDQWQQFVLKEIIKGNPEIRTVTLLGKEYSHGHNLQTFNTVVHLDRNHWNSEAMKQRTARAYRQGQEERVQEVTIDSTYAPNEEAEAQDVTLDQIRELYQKMDAAIFDDIIKASQDLDLTAENKSVLKRDASNWRLDEAVLELQTSPYAKRSRPPGVKMEGDE
ncbi:MAG: SNF2-related protein [Planctomycetota bacterium]|nr:SNF2-related protein [Planctomycetota bacterium]